MVLTDAQFPVPYWAIPILAVFFIISRGLALLKEWREVAVMALPRRRAAPMGSKRRHRQLFFFGVATGVLEGLAVALRPSARAAGWCSPASLTSSMGILIAVSLIVMFWDLRRTRRGAPDKDVEAYSMGFILGCMSVVAVLIWFTL